MTSPLASGEAPVVPVAGAATTSWPVVIEARHVRLTAAHIEMLFGPGHALLELVPLSPTGRFASADVVDVRGPGGALKSVRVLGPIASTTRVYLSDDDAADCGLDVNRTGGVSVDGPRGTLVLAAGAVVDVRRLVMPSGASGGATSGSADVLVRGERARELRGVPVEVSAEAGETWLALDVANANAMDIGPASRATASSRG